MTPNKLYLFIDGSANPQSKQGVGALLAIESLSTPINELEHRVLTRKFTHTSSTQLELETLLWAFETLAPKLSQAAASWQITCYTDCSNIVGLPLRRARLEQRGYLNSKGVLIKNHLLYKKLLQLIHQQPITFIKTAGHQPGYTKDTVAQIFSLVDKKARRILRQSL